jgi:hypothetical protein
VVSGGCIGMSSLPVPIVKLMVSAVGGAAVGDVWSILSTIVVKSESTILSFRLLLSDIASRDDVGNEDYDG